MRLKAAKEIAANYGFNPRICKRCDWELPLVVAARPVFQSTHL